MIVKIKKSRKLINDDIRIGLEKDKNYIVYGIAVWTSGVVFYVASAPGFDYPYPLPDRLFEVVDASVPEDWIMKQRNDAYGNPALRVSFPEMVDDKDFNDNLYDGLENERGIFLGYKQKYENLYKDLLK